MSPSFLTSAPNDLERRRRAVAVPEKPPAPSFQPVTNEDCRGNNQRSAFRRVSSTNEYTTRKTRKRKASTCTTNRDDLLPGVLGSAPTQFFRAKEPAVGLEFFLVKRSWGEKVVDLQFGETSLVRADPNTGFWPHGLSRAGSWGDSSRMWLRSPDAVFFVTRARWLGYELLENMLLHMGLFGFFVASGKQKIRK